MTTQLTPGTLAALIAGAGVVTSWVGSIFIAGYRWGTVKARIDTLETSLSNMATKEQLSSVKESLAEIKGMFQLIPREFPHNPHE